MPKTTWNQPSRVGGLECAAEDVGLGAGRGRDRWGMGVVGGWILGVYWCRGMGLSVSLRHPHPLSKRDAMANRDDSGAGDCCKPNNHPTKHRYNGNHNDLGVGDWVMVGPLKENNILYISLKYACVAGFLLAFYRIIINIQLFQKIPLVGKGSP